MKKLLSLISVFILLSSIANARTMSCTQENWDTLTEMRDDFLAEINENHNNVSGLFYYIRDNKEEIYRTKTKSDIQRLLEGPEKHFKSNKEFGSELASKLYDFLDGCQLRSNRREARKVTRKVIKEIGEIRKKYTENTEYAINHMKEFIKEFEEAQAFISKSDK
jgi:hypothetical protein